MTTSALAPAIAWLARLIAVDTTSHLPTAPLVDLLEAHLVALGARTWQVGARDGKRSLVAHLGPDRPGGVTLSGHLDVVPTEGQPWSSDPFTLTRRGDALFGRGTADMKGFLAATLTALDALGRARLARLDAPVALVLTCDEEVGCHGSAEVAGWLRAQGLRLPEATLIGEPTGFAVMRMHPGHVHVRITLRGEAAHSSMPELGVSAVSAAARLVTRLDALAEQLRQERADLPLERPYVVLHTAAVHGGGAVNIVPDHATVDVGFRPLPGTSPDDVVARIRAALPRADEGIQASLHVHAVVPSLLTPDGTELAAALRRHAEAGPPAVPFATDGGNLARAGLAPLVFGPGRIDVAHKADEHLAVADLDRAVATLGQLIVDRCGGA